MVDRKVVPLDEFYYQLKLTHVFQKHPVYELSDSCFTISYKHKIYPFQKTRFLLLSPTPLVLYSFSPLPFLSHPSPCRLRSIFLPVPFSPSLSFRRMCSFSCLLFIRVFVPLPFYSPSPCIFSLLLLEIFLQFLLSLIPYKPLPVYLYFPVSNFTLFPVSVSSLANSLNFFCVSLFSFVKSSSIYILSFFFPSTYSYLA
jgi:hypothetical protein